MRISAIIPTFNRPEHTQRAIESVLSQTHPPDELIVVDDGSTDDTPRTLRDFGKEIHVVTQEHAGVSGARNGGIAASSGDWLAFLDSDDLWLPGKLEAQMEAVNTPANEECLVIYTDEKWIKNGKRRNQGKRHQKYSGWIYEHCLPLCIISPSSVMVHATVFDTVGVFDISLPACEDYDMWLRICARYPVLYLDEKLIVKQAGAWPQLSAEHSLDKYRIIALRKILDAGGTTHWQRLLTQDALEEKIGIYARGCRKHGRANEAAWAERMISRG